MNKYTYDEVYESSLNYFNGDELATNVFVTKYCLKDNSDNYLELTPDDMHKRIAMEFARIEKKKYDKTNVKALSEEFIYELLKDFKYIIPQGSPMFGIGNKYQLVSLSNCFVLTTPEDSYGGILNTDEELVQVSKRRGGVGIDLSKLRPRGSKTKNAAKSSTGIVSFMERYSNSIREVGQDGRRGALMLTYDVAGIDIFEFVKAKEDLTKVTGANISVKISDEFMNAVINDTDFYLRFPIDTPIPKNTGLKLNTTYTFKNNNKEIYIKRIKASELWDDIVKMAHKTAEPGLLFWDNILKYSPTTSYEEEGFKSESTNPCVVGETLVLTNKGWFEIQNLEKYKEKYPDLKIITRDKAGKLTYSELEWVGITKKDSEIWKIEFDNKETLLTTPDHELYNENFELCKVQDLKKSVMVISGGGLVKVVNSEKTKMIRDVWDLTANPNYNFFSILDRKEIEFKDKIKINNTIELNYFDLVRINGVIVFAHQIKEDDEIEIL